MRTVLLAVTLLAGCASEASWKTRDARGWPVPTWARMGSYPALADGCAGMGHGVITSPDSLGPRGDAQAVLCGYANPGWRAREDLRRIREIQAQMHLR